MSRLGTTWFIGAACALFLASGAPTYAESPATATFPRCSLDDADRDVFHQRYGAGHLALADADFEAARDHLRAALEICVDDEVLWFLSQTYEQLGDKERAARYMASWRTQRRLEGAPEVEPERPAPALIGRASNSTEGPAVIAKAPQEPRFPREPLFPERSSKIAPLELTPATPLKRPASLRLPKDEQRFARTRAYFHSESSPPSLELPFGPRAEPKPLLSARLHERTMEPRKRVGVLSLSTTPEGATIEVVGVGVIGTSPLQEHQVPAGRDLTLVIKKQGYRTIERTVYVRAGINQRLFITLRRDTSGQ